MGCPVNAYKILHTTIAVYCGQSLSEYIGSAEARTNARSKCRGRAKQGEPVSDSITVLACVFPQPNTGLLSQPVPGTSSTSASVGVLGTCLKVSGSRIFYCNPAVGLPQLCDEGVVWTFVQGIKLGPYHCISIRWPVLADIFT